MVKKSVPFVVLLLAGLLSSPLLRGDKAPDARVAPESAAARSAIDKCDRASADAEKVYRKAILNAKFQMNIDLRKAQQLALHDGKQDEALAIAAKIRSTEEELLAQKSAERPETAAFEIKRVQWGADKTWVDVTREVTVRNDTFQIVSRSWSDPVPGVHKHLMIDGTIGGIPFRFDTLDNADTVRLSRGVSR